MIHKFSQAHQTRWGRGEYKVQLNVPGSPRPMGYCDGSVEDEAELRQMAEEEGVEHLVITKRPLKTGREVWTIGDPTAKPAVSDDD